MVQQNKPLLGAHMSIAGGLHLALERGAELGCATIQIFTKNASQWRERSLTSDEVELFGSSLGKLPIRPVLAHGAYLVNPASPEEGIWKRSVASLRAEVERCHELGLPGVIIHPGSHRGAGEERGLARVAEALRLVLEETKDSAVRIILENTAGQGYAVGHRFEHLARIIGEVGVTERLGVCFDTAHAFAAGYDLRTAGAYERTMASLEGAVGLEKVRAIHLNDARKGLGSRVDRHDHIGRGELGFEAFRLIMNDRRFIDRPKILETPKYDGDTVMDPVNLEILRGLVGQSRPSRPQSSRRSKKS